MSVERIELKRERRSKAIQVQEGIATAALRNEALTRQRVEALEAQADGVAQLLARDLWGRLTWLVWGR